jgi:hypothetical protein
MPIKTNDLSKKLGKIWDDIPMEGFLQVYILELIRDLWRVGLVDKELD